MTRAGVLGRSEVTPKAEFAVLRLTLGLAITLIVFTAVGCGPKEKSPPQPSPTVASPAVTSPEPTAKEDSDLVPISRDEVITKIDELIARRDHKGATAQLQQLLLVDPNDAGAIFRLAGIKASTGGLSEAIDLLAGIPNDHPEAGLPALGQSADWCLQLKRYDQAESRYREILKRVPQAAPALRQLAYLLNRQGRRHEAAVYIRELCKQGDIRQDELHSLIALSDAMYDSPQTQSNPHTPANPYWPIGPGGEARKKFNEKKFSEAVDLLRPVIEKGTTAPALSALFGLAAVEAQDDVSFHWWLSNSDRRTRDYAEYWSAIGGYLLSRQRFDEAIRALVEAVNRDPTDLRSMGRLRQAFAAINDKAAEKNWFDRWTEVRETLRVNNRIAATNPPNPEAIADLASRLEELQRPLEAVLWRAIEQHYRNAPQAERVALNQKRQRLVSSRMLFPDQSHRLCGLALTDYPLPKVEMAESSTGAQFTRREPAAQATFENVSKEYGLTHTYAVATHPVARGYSVYQMLGGGVAVIDYDLDGNADLYLAQGAANPPNFQGDRSNRLVRNLGMLFRESTTASNATDSQYSIGVTAGDWNQDGFPDLAVTNIGLDLLLVNNGDGTFAKKKLSRQANLDRVPSSIVIADLTGDSLPDLFQASYVDDPRKTMKPPTNQEGHPLQPILPSKFNPGPNVLLENDGSGGFQVKPFVGDSTSLGLIVGNFNDSPSNEVFVANDMDANRLWTRSPIGAWSDVAALSGCAFSYTGAATASMGVAASDFDRSGTLDLHVTNYQDESVSLFLNGGETFQDRHVQFQLAVESRSVLGFGTQPIDYDNDGLCDLAVTNGHIEDAVENTGPFQQPAQLFCNLGDRFELTSVKDDSGYWAENHVGRAMAMLDIDKDGSNDLVVTHIDQATALLVNQTQNENHWLQLKLVGTESERDSIGAVIRLMVGDQVQVQWATTGDGYLVRNENVVCFGLGKSSKIDQITIDWPSGNRQVIADPPVNRRLLVIENDDEPYTFFSSKSRRFKTR